MHKLKLYLKYIICFFKLIIAYIYVQFYKKKLFEYNIWLIQEKHTEARDNGYHLFRYLRMEHPEINVYFSITKDSPDRIKVEKCGNVINADTIKHYIFYLCSKNSIGSQKFGACPYPTDWVNRFNVFRRKDQKVIFLQHGVLTNSAPGLEYKKTGFDLFVCSTQREYDYVHNDLKYPEKKVQILGLCRYDNLTKNTHLKKQILIMPTFRRFLAAKDVEHDATSTECQRFEKSYFYENYYSLLTDETLLKNARKHHFSIVFYMHYSLQAYTKVFAKCGNDVVRIADKYTYDVQNLMIDSSIMVTDYSSVFYDFAYMEKPELYFQFDEDEFRKKHYGKGFFDYRMDGFGPVYTKKDDVVLYLVKLMENGCKMEEQYIKRVNEFFTFHDRNNCRRNFEAIINLQ